MSETMPKPSPAPDRFSEEFWAGANRGELVIQRCSACGRLQHPPMPVCSNCLGLDFEYVPVSGRGTVYSYTVAHHVVVPGFEEDAPYVVALVELEDQQGLRVLFNLRETPPEGVHGGMPVQVAFGPRQGEYAVPFFIARS
mgnify:CR=1 FL=1